MIFRFYLIAISKYVNTFATLDLTGANSCPRLVHKDVHLLLVMFDPDNCEAFKLCWPCECPLKIHNNYDQVKLCLAMLMPLEDGAAFKVQTQRAPSCHFLLPLPVNLPTMETAVKFLTPEQQRLSRCRAI